MRLFKWTLSLLIVTLLLTASVVIGSRRILVNQMKPAVRELAAQMCEPQPCWHNIQVGVTTLEQSQKIMQHISQISSHCWEDDSIGGLVCLSTDENNLVTGLMRTTYNLHLNDLFLLYGEPLAFSYCEGPLNESRERITTIVVIFSDNVWVTVSSFITPYPSELRLTPDRSVESIDYRMGNSETEKAWRGQADPIINSWHGFTNLSDPPRCW